MNGGVKRKLQDPLPLKLGDVHVIKRADGSFNAAEFIEWRMLNDQIVEIFVHYLGKDSSHDEWITPDRILRAKIRAPCDMSMSSSEKENVRPLAKAKARRRAVARPLKVAGDPQMLSKPRYITTLYYGAHEVEPGYYSPFPKGYDQVSTLYVCELCLKYMRFPNVYLYHIGECTVKQPPGTEIYRKDNLSVYEIDGATHKAYGQQLCLLAKLFLANKALYLDLEPFLFYALCERRETGAHLVGYFSKEKCPLENNVLSCIMVLPPYQRKGYGTLLMDISYELARRHGMIGGPEKPLSDVGLVSYRRYWAYKLLQLMREVGTTRQSVERLCYLSGIGADDIIYTLHSMKMLKYVDDKPTVCVTKKTLDEQLQLYRKRPPKLQFDAALLNWAPPQVKKRTSAYKMRQLYQSIRN